MKLSEARKKLSEKPRPALEAVRAQIVGMNAARKRLELLKARG